MNQQPGTSESPQAPSQPQGNLRHWKMLGIAAILGGVGLLFASFWASFTIGRNPGPYESYLSRTLLIMAGMTLLAGIGLILSLRQRRRGLALASAYTSTLLLLLGGPWAWNAPARTVRDGVWVDAGTPATLGPQPNVWFGGLLDATDYFFWAPYVGVLALAACGVQLLAGRDRKDRREDPAEL